MHENIYKLLPYRNVKILTGCNNKKRKMVKPWWNDKLTQAWIDMCVHEKQWLKSKYGHEKSVLKVI
jgi:hypothetical protein